MTTSFNPDIHSSSVHLFSFIKSERIYGGVHFCFFKNRPCIISRRFFFVYVLVVFSVNVYFGCRSSGSQTRKSGREPGL